MKKTIPLKKPLPRNDKYFLRDLHQEIGLYDRKLAHLNKYVEFASSAEREEAEKKLLTKRAPLEKAARELVASGVEYDEKDIPQSLRTKSVEEDSERQNLFLVKRS